ncbi:hypothetical protein MUP56_02375 [Patescibacteria group bacterium]|nr:hypothetical protein [Patescibacteria group bacterium]
MLFRRINTCQKVAANSAKASEITQMLDISVGKLPVGETEPTNADFLIIVGADKK